MDLQKLQTLIIQRVSLHFGVSGCPSGYYAKPEIKIKPAGGLDLDLRLCIIS